MSGGLLSIGSLSGQGMPSAKPLLSGLPLRGNYLIKNAHIITMDDQIGDFPNGDLHLNNGIIKAVGENINAEAAEIIEAKGMIVIPGFIETHWHMWNSIFRSMAVDDPGEGYFDTRTEIGGHFTPDDMYNGNLLSVTEALFSGITTVHDWNHNIRSLEHAEYSIKAIKDAGIRARFSFGNPVGLDDEEPVMFGPLEHLADNWQDYSNEGLIALGFAWRGIEGNIKVGEAELNKVRSMGLPVTVHASSAGIIGRLAYAGLLGPDMLIVHGMQATGQEIESMVKAGAPISLSPFSELRIGYGFPEVPELVRAGATIGLSVDTTVLSGNSDMFAIMKNILNITNALEQDEFKLSPRQVLEMATIDGARSMGIADITGSISPGKRADITMVDGTAINMQPMTDAVNLLVEAAQPANVHSVWADGRLLKHKGNLTHLSVEEVGRKATRSYKEIIKKSK
ncbi:hypothetical protein EL17_16160 [Anditalea andensis]|uniref:Amidohydrolase-related domain-containing protein n=2 Tax=Anditalea andensis TaxID=1048983 RepID=A0A074KTP6_9BACT|nr:hypothetical protein EL17_16160 [Anditalea andensis]